MAFELFVNGGLMRGLSLHANMEGAEFLEECATAPRYQHNIKTRRYRAAPYTNPLPPTLPWKDFLFGGHKYARRLRAARHTCTF